LQPERDVAGVEAVAAAAATAVSLV
jgi:hypothetical protein